MDNDISKKYEQKFAEYLLNRKQELEKELSEINALLGVGMQSKEKRSAAPVVASANSVSLIEYPHSGSWTAKVKYVLYNSDKPLLNTEVVDIVAKAENGERNTIRKSVSPVLSKNEKDAFLVKEVEGKKYYSIVKA